MISCEWFVICGELLVTICDYLRMVCDDW